MARVLVGALVSMQLLCPRALAGGDDTNNVEVYAGSTGTGVSVDARAKVDEVERYLQDAKGPDGRSPRYTKSFPGLEGEVMLCVELHDAARRDTLLADLRRIVGTAARISIRPSRCLVR